MVRYRCAVQNVKQRYRLYGRPTGIRDCNERCCELVAKAVSAIGAVLLCGWDIMDITVVRERVIFNTVNYNNTGIYVYDVYIVCKILHSKPLLKRLPKTPSGGYFLCRTLYMFLL